MAAMGLCSISIITMRYITAAKAALFRFIQSRETSQREKDLLKSVKVSSNLL